MPSVSWRHERRQLLLPLFIFPGLDSENPNESVRVSALLDTGATGTGIRRDIAEQLDLRKKGVRRVGTANGLVVAPEYVIRVGFVCGDYTDPDFNIDAQFPYVLSEPLVGFGLEAGFSYAALIGMDVIGYSDLILTRDGEARLTLP